METIDNTENSRVIPEVPPMQYRAILDERRIYQGMEEVEELQDGDVEVPADCDLPKNEYFWNGETFLPLAIFKGVAP